MATDRDAIGSMNQTRPVSGKTFWFGWCATVLATLPFIPSAIMKFVKPPEVVEGFAQLGFPEHLAVGLGVLEIGCVVVYLIPRTSVLGAILLTGYLGGAIVTHLRVGDSFLIPLTLGVLVWVGIFLREHRLHALIPLRTRDSG